MDESAARALIDELLELARSLRADEVADRLASAPLRLGLARGAELALAARAREADVRLARGEAGGEPELVLELEARGERLGRLRLFAARAPAGSALEALRALAAHGATALANARAHEAALLRADHDALTGLANFGRITAALEHELERAQRYRRELAVAMFDVDDLKRWNDRFGHPEGNAALVRLAALLRERSRSSDTAGRYGGDELMLILPETSSSGALAVAEKVRAAFESGSAGRASEADARVAPLTVSAGVASAGADGKTAAELLGAADARLYRAKAAGGNRVVA